MTNLTVTNQGKFSVFNHSELGQIRAWIVEDEVRFNLYDICINLGYIKKNSIGIIYLRKDLIENICETLGITGVSPTDTNKIVINKESDFENTYIEESSFYDFALESKAKNAREFRKWVTNEVLPQIRQTGGYIPVKQEDDEESILAKAYIIARKTLEKKEEIIQKQTLQIEEMKPKVSFVDRLLKSKDNLLVREYSKILQDEGFNLGEKKLYKWFRENKYLMDNKEPYQQFMKYFAVIENTIDTIWGEKLVKTTKIRPEGQLYFYEKLRKDFNFNT